MPNSDPKAPPAYIALSDVADVRLETGAAYIYRENSQRFIPLKYSVRERDLGSTVAEAQERIAKNVPLPQGYRMEWSGEFGALQEAKKRLAVIVPLSLILILALLYSLFNSVRDSLIALSGIPFAVCGGILGLYVAGLNASVSAAVGFISLFGVAAMDGILLVSYIRRDLEEGMGTETAIIQAGEARMRQVFMTGFSACIGLVPGGALHRHRLAGPAAAGLRDRRRHAAVADLQPAGDPDRRAPGHAGGRRAPRRPAKARRQQKPLSRMRAACAAPLGTRSYPPFFLPSPNSLQRAIAASMSFCSGQTLGGKRAPPRSGSGS